jgi:hypothetical protein
MVRNWGLEQTTQLPRFSPFCTGEKRGKMHHVIPLLFSIATVIYIWATIHEGVAARAIPWKMVGGCFLLLCSLLFWLLI